MDPLIPLILVIIMVMVLMLAGLPVVFAFGLGSFILIFWLGLDVRHYMPASFKYLQGFALVALPLYIICGVLMSDSGMAARLFRFANSVVGRIKGGLGASLVVANGIFGAISGSATAAIGALGAITAPEMEKEGYPRGFVTALIASSAPLSMIIPPSIAMIIFGVTSKMPIGLLFLGTFIPGVCLVILLIVVNLVMTRRLASIRVMPKVGFVEQVKDFAMSGRKATFSLLMPVIILGGIYGGILSPTEAAGVGALYCLFVGLFIYRSLNIKGVGSAFLGAAVTTGSIFIIFFFFFVMSQVIVIEQLPDRLLALMLQISDNKYVILALLNVILLFMGMLMDDISGLILAAIILLPVAKSIGVDPFHFAAIAVINLSLGVITPPVAPILYLAGSVVGDVPLSEYIRPTLYFIVFAYLPVLAITTYVPELSLTLIRLFQ